MLVVNIFVYVYLINLSEETYNNQTYLYSPYFIHVTPSTLEVLPFIPVKIMCLRTSAQQMADFECDIIPLGDDPSSGLVWHWELP